MLHLLTAVLYAEILSTTSLQPTAFADAKKLMVAASVGLMMGVGATPLSIYLKF